jgi:adenylate cyclase
MSPSRDIGKFLSRATRLRRWATAWSSVWLAILIGVLMLLAGRSEFAEQRRERNFDLLLASRRLPPSPEIVIVDIDQRSLAAKGQWPWVATGSPR